MRILTLIGFGAFLITTLVVGIRLLWMAQRTRELPELLIGIAMLALGPLGYGVAVGASLLPGLGHELLLAATAIGVVDMSLGAAALYVFIWRVFRPSEAWVQGLCFLSLVLLAVSTVGDVVARLLVRVDGIGFWFWLAFSLRLLPMWWSCFESLRYWRRMLRRTALGIGDPVVARSFLLWGIGSAAAGAAFTTGFGCRLFLGVGANQHPTVALLLSLMALVAGVAIGLAFFPPRPRPSRFRPGTAHR